MGVEGLKYESNFGGVVRAAVCYGANLLVIQPKYQHNRLDTTKGYKHIPLIETKDVQSCLPKSCVPIAIENTQSDISLIDFVHPERAFYVFGSEDKGLSDITLKWCKKVVHIPTQHCMNLAATVNVVLYDRLSKENRK